MGRGRWRDGVAVGGGGVESQQRSNETCILLTQYTGVSTQFTGVSLLESENEPLMNGAF